MSRRADVIVIGGGPMGALAARCAAEAGASTLLLERRIEKTASSSCAGLVSPRTLPLLGASARSVLRSIRAVDAFGPGGRKVQLRSEDVKAFVLDRESLEEELLNRAERAGVKIRPDTTAKKIRSGCVECRSSGREATLDAGMIIVATGPSAPVVHASELPVPPRLLPSAQATIEDTSGLNENGDCVSICVGADVAPGFFAWSVPAEPGALRIGLAVREGENAVESLGRLLKARHPSAKVLHHAGGQIVVGPVHDPVRSGILLVGDAAGHVKPLSGGGLYFGGICARIAGRMAAEAVRMGRTHATDLAEYPERCDRAIGRELRFGLAARALLDSLSDQRLSEAMAALGHPDLLAFLAEIGDIDRIRRIPRALLKKRRLWRRLLPFLGLLDTLLAGDTADSAVAPSLTDFL